MKPLLINLTEEQTEYLREIKRQHGVNMGSYIRHMLKLDMERSLGRGVSIVAEEHGSVPVSKQTMVKRLRMDATHLELIKELSPILEARRKRADRYIVPCQSAYADSGEVEE